MKYTASPGLRNLFRHLSIVASHYQDRERARLKFDKHVKRLEKAGKKPSRKLAKPTDSWEDAIQDRRAMASEEQDLSSTQDSEHEQQKLLGK